MKPAVSSKPNGFTSKNDLPSFIAQMKKTEEEDEELDGGKNSIKSSNSSNIVLLDFVAQKYHDHLDM